MLEIEVLSPVGRSVESVDPSSAGDESRLAQLGMDHAGVAILRFDAEGRIEYANKFAAELSGYAVEELLGKTIFDLDPEMTLDHWHEQAESMRRGPLHTSDRRHRRKDGASTHVEVTANLLELEGKTCRFAIVRDVTERKKAELELISARESAEASNRAKSEFLASMSHEIRTPMNGILGMTELALETDLTPDQQEYLNLVKVSADSLLVLINDILDFSKVEAGKLDVESIDFALRGTLREAMKSVAPKAQKKGIELVWSLDPSVPDAVVGDPFRLRQIILNIVDNAIKFTDHGEVTLRGWIEGEQPNGFDLRLVIADTGTGIPAEKQKLIFEAFRQADGSTSRNFGGTGLGLAICRRLAELMKGRIWVESEVGKGSEFHIRLALGLQAEARRLPHPDVPADLHGIRTLVVDDHLTTRKVLCEMMESFGVQTREVEDSGRALATLREAADKGDPFSIVLVDAHLGGSDGFDLATTIKRDPSLQGVSIILLTGAGQRGDAARCREIGVEAYFSKPVASDDLLGAVRTIRGLASSGKSVPCTITQHTLRESRQRLRVLLAEDNLVNQKVAVRILERRGHSVAVVGNGEDAIAALDREPFDLVLMDVQMPVLGGMEATARIREREKLTGGHVPIIALTAHAMSGDADRCVQAGMDSYHSKPIRPNVLLELIENLAPEKSARASG